MPLLSTIGLGAVFAREGEAASYLRPGSDPRTILVVADREPADSLTIGDGVPTPRLRIHVRNHPTAGITPAELDRGRDRIRLPLRIGEAPRDLQVAAILHQDDGVLVLEVR
jgi:hypothetical protein